MRRPPKRTPYALHHQTHGSRRNRRGPRRPGVPRVRAAEAPTSTWTRTYRPNGNASTLVRDVAPVDEGFVLAGVTGDDFYRGWVAGVDGTGAVRWDRRLGTGQSGFYAGAPLGSGGVLLAGWTNGGSEVERHTTGDPWVVRVTDEGSVEWGRTYQPSTAGGRATDLTRTPTGYVVAGASGVAGERRPWVAGIDALGTVRWRWRSDRDDRTGAAEAVASVGDGVVVAGSNRPVDAEGDGASEDAWVVGRSANGEKRWQHRFTGERGDRIETLAPRQAGGVVAAGKRGFSTDDDGDAWLAGLDGSGEPAWERTYPRDQWNWVHDVVAVDDGYLVVGTRERDDSDRRGAWLLRVGPRGAPRWSGLYDDGVGTEGWAVRSGADDGILLAGSTTAETGEPGWLAQIGGDATGTGSAGGGIGRPSIPAWTAPFVTGVGVGAVLARVVRLRGGS